MSSRMVILCHYFRYWMVVKKFCSYGFFAITTGFVQCAKERA